MRILIADDASDVASRLKAMLSDLERVQVIGPAQNGQEALDLYHQHRPHGIVLDLQMPVLNGLQVLETIRKHDRSTLVIVLTNLEETEMRRRCMESGASFFLSKSGEFDQVADIISDFVRKHEKQKPA